MVGASGEPWQTRVGFESAARSLSESGWRVLSQVAEAEVAPTRFWEANPHLQTMRLVQLIHACRSETGTVDLDESVG